MLTKGSDIGKELSELRNASQDEKQAVVDKYVEIEFKEMKPKKCTHEFSTPHIASEALALMKEDTDNFSDCVLMKKQYKKNENGAVLATPKGKPKMEWVLNHQEEIQLVA